MEEGTGLCDDWNHQVKHFPTLADIKSEPQEDDTSGTIRNAGNWPDPVFIIKTEPQEESRPELCLPDWSYLNPESEDEAEEEGEEKYPVNMVVVKTENLGLKTVDEDQQSGNESPVDQFLEVDITVKEEAGRCSPLFVDVHERKEDRPLEREGIADVMPEDRMSASEADDVLCDHNVAISAESYKIRRVDGFCHPVSLSDIQDKSDCKLGSLNDHENTFQDEDNDKISSRLERRSESSNYDNSLGQNKCVPHSLDSGKAEYKCDICGKVFSSSISKNFHVTIHSGQKLYKCEHCEQELSSKQRLKQHLHTVHSEKKEYNCSRCGQKFGDSCNMKKHVQIEHLNEKTFECHHCGQKFSKNCNMKKHVESVHLKERHYECRQCGQKFSKKCNLKKHTQIVHQNIRHFECQQCEKAFASKQSMERHIQIIHLKVKQYKCLQCEQTFGERCGLKRHIQTVHMKLREFECQHCGHRFYHSCDMKKHVQTVHLKMRQFPCQHCGQRFSKNWNMKAHVKTIHMKQN